MRFKQYLLVIIGCLTLVSCASTRMAQDLQAGKASYQGGYFKEAFHQLLPLAVKGNAEAQYAIGYMYYYGYGVSDDAESGIFWMTKAAEQNYVPAIKALELIHQHNTAEAHEEQHQQYYVPIATPKTKKMSFSENNEHEAPVRIATTAEEKQDLNSEPVQAAAARNYTLQLYGSYHLAAVKDLQTELRLKNTGHVYQTTHQGKDWYVLTFGNFVTAHEASATQNNLPGQLKHMHPWVRNVHELVLV